MMRLRIRRQRPNESDAAYDARRAREDEEHAALCEQIRQGNEVIARAEFMALRVMLGLASAEEIREVMALDDHTNPYVYVGALRNACVACGLNAETGKPR